MGSEATQFGQLAKQHAAGVMDLARKVLANKGTHTISQVALGGECAYRALEIKILNSGASRDIIKAVETIVSGDNVPAEVRPSLDDDGIIYLMPKRDLGRGKFTEDEAEKRFAAFSKQLLADLGFSEPAKGQGRA